MLQLCFLPRLICSTDLSWLLRVYRFPKCVCFFVSIVPYRWHTQSENRSETIVYINLIAIIFHLLQLRYFTFQRSYFFLHFLHCTPQDTCLLLYASSFIPRLSSKWHGWSGVGQACLSAVLATACCTATASICEHDRPAARPARG